MCVANVGTIREAYVTPQDNVENLDWVDHDNETGFLAGEIYAHKVVLKFVATPKAVGLPPRVIREVVITSPN